MNHILEHPITKEMNSIDGLKRFEEHDVIEWRCQSYGSLPTATRMHLRGLTTDLYIFKAACYFGYLQKGDIPKEIFELLNKDLDTFSLFPTRFRLENTASEVWACSIQFESSTEFFNPNQVEAIYRQINLVGQEALCFLEQQNYVKFLKILDEIFFNENVFK